MKRLAYWVAKLRAAQAEERTRRRELNQMQRAFERAMQEVTKIEQRISHEKAKLARPK